MSSSRGTFFPTLHSPPSVAPINVANPRRSGVLAEKPSDQLFAVDTAGDAALPKTLAHRARTSIKPLKADQILGQRSAIPAVDARKRSGLGVTDGVLEPRSKRHRAPYVSATEYARLRRVGRGSASATQPPVGGEDGAPTHDPWAVAPEAAAGDEPHAFLTPPRAVREPATLRTSPVSLLAGAKAAPAVARPRPGTSYNPSFGDWDALLAAAGAREVAAEVQRRAEARRREELEAKIVAAQEEEEEAARAGEGGESVWEGIESEFEDAGAAGGEAGRVKKVKIKTRAERNKIRRRKEAEREEKLKLKGRKLEEQVGSVKKMVKELRRQESQKKSGKALATESDGSESEEVDDERLRRHLKKSLFVVSLLPD